MQTPLARVLATAGIVVAAFAALAGPAQAQSSTPCSSRYQLAWEMPLRSSDVGKSVSSVLGRSEFYPVIKPRGDMKRLAIGRAPDSTVGLQMNIRRGENAAVSFSTAPFGSRGVDAACLSLRVFMENGFEWPKGGTKMGWGLWGGSERESAGGTLPSNQLGWTIRNVNTRYGFRLYSYHLNRPARYGAQGRPVARWGSNDYRAGRWHKIDLEVVMNTVGKNDGYAQVWLDGKNRRTMSNLRFRNNADWAIRGLLFNDMWGGNTGDPVNFSPKNQRMWYADYKLYRAGGSSVARRSDSSSSSGSPSRGSSSRQSSTSSSGGSFGPVSPSGNVRTDNVVVKWRPDPQADRYYVRVIRTSDRKDMFGGSAWPRDCSGSLCSRSIGNLPRGSYEWFVRPQYGSRRGTYQSLKIDVS